MTGCMGDVEESGRCAIPHPFAKTRKDGPPGVCVLLDELAALDAQVDVEEGSGGG